MNDRETAAAHRRAAGKAAVAARTVWQLQVGAVALRCLAEPEGFVVEARTSSGWEPVAPGTNAHMLLERVVRLELTVRAIEQSTEFARGLMAQSGTREESA